MLLPSRSNANGSRSPGGRLRSLLASGGLVRAPGVSDALSAKLVERAGFEAVHITGGGLARTLGFPDVGLVTLTEAVSCARSIAGAVQIPIIADADTGYGNALNVIRTVREFEGAGVAAIHLEDQVTPKRCGHYEGTQLVPTAEMVGKLKAACAARSNADIVIIARTDARGVEGFDGAVSRARAYRAAGADLLLVEAPETVDEIRDLVAAIDAPLLINMYSGGKTPIVSVQDLRGFGYRVVIFPSHLQRASIRAMQRALDLLRREDASAADDPALMVSFREREATVDFDSVKALEARYLHSAEFPQSPAASDLSG